MTYQVSGGFVRPSLYSNANLLENKLLLLLFKIIINENVLNVNVWVADAALQNSAPTE